MSRRMLAIALLLAGAAAAAAEAAPASVVQSGRETQAEPKLTTVSERKSTQRKGGEAPKPPRGTSKPPLPLLDQKNLGLGCAQG